MRFLVDVIHRVFQNLSQKILFIFSKIISFLLDYFQMGHASIRKIELKNFER